MLSCKFVAAQTQTMAIQPICTDSMGAQLALLYQMAQLQLASDNTSASVS